MQLIVVESTPFSGNFLEKLTKCHGGGGGGQKSMMLCQFSPLLTVVDNAPRWGNIEGCIVD